MTATVRGISLQGRDGSEDLEGVREYTVIYKVVTDDKRDGAKQVLAAFGVPSVGDIYVAGNDTDFATVVIGRTATPVDGSAWEWEVEVKYSNDLEDAPIGFKDNPFSQPAEISYGFQNRRILVPGRFNDPIGPPGDKAWEQGIFAPNGELFDPQPEIEISEPILTIKRNVQSINGAEMMALANCVNLDTFENAEPRQLKLNAPQAGRKWHKQYGFYWEISYSIAYRWDTWDLQILNQGTYYFPGGKPANVWSSTATAVPKTDASGNPRVINLSTNGDVTTGEIPTFTRLRIYREISFSSLGLI